MSNDTRVGLVPLDRIDFHAHNVRQDLGDLRSLTASIAQLGVMQPVVLEVRGQRLRVRSGHRRVAAARLAGLGKVPAVIHGSALDDDEWLVAATHENTRRRGLDMEDRARTVEAMRKAGMTWPAIGAAFGVTAAMAQRYQLSADQRAGRRKHQRPRISPARLDAFVAHAREQLAAGVWSADDLLDALTALTQESTTERTPS